MRNYRRTLPVAIAIAFGLVTILGMLFLPELSGSMTAWASFLAGVALLLGVINLLGVHARRVPEGNFYSAILVLSVVVVFILGLLDFSGRTENSVDAMFNVIQLPLEMAVASLIAFFLLFAGVRMLRQQRSLWAVLFIIAAILMLISRTALPGPFAGLFRFINDILSGIFVTSGIRGILLGVAIGIVAMSLRILTGSERPYDK